MLLTQIGSSVYDSFLSLIYPHACAICGMSVENRSDAPACLLCWQRTRLFVAEEVLCWKCGSSARPPLRLVEPSAIRCNKCDLHEFIAARACGLYEGALRASVLQLKKQPRVSAKLISLLVSTAKREPLNKATMIIPVPLHPERERTRGFNQATEISRAISSQLALALEEHSLVRVAASEKYRAGLDAKGRSDTVMKAFHVRLPRRIEGENILLVDDVFTTGATASSCASVLLAAGAKSVLVLTIARPQ